MQGQNLSGGETLSTAQQDLAVFENSVYRGIPLIYGQLKRENEVRDHGILRLSLLFQVPKPPVELRCHNGRPFKKTRFLPTNMAIFSVGNSNAFGFFKPGNGKSTIY